MLPSTAWMVPPHPPPLAFRNLSPGLGFQVLFFLPMFGFPSVCLVPDCITIGLVVLLYCKRDKLWLSFLFGILGYGVVKVLGGVVFVLKKKFQMFNRMYRSNRNSYPYDGRVDSFVSAVRYARKVS